MGHHRDSTNVDFIGTTPNACGYFNLDKLYKCWDFCEKTLDATNVYTLFIDTDSTVAIGAGGVVMTTQATDTKTATIACGGLFIRPADNPVVEFRFQINNIATVAMFAGFHDATAENTSLLPFSITAATLTDTATDAAGFLFDTLQTADYWNIVNTNNGTEAFTQLASTYVPVNATDVTLRVALNAAGDAEYFYNGASVGTKALAVATTGLFCPFFGIRNNTTAARIATLRRVSLWMDQ